ncbi:DUF6476 family protein [Celeribacter sp. SCSIO 80788]|uniref:DUF6476 family protein n=1 Tax=Celeribacter sp. SCSIO 80788 TaxID=3117013 RepID=UPI003DA6968C
MSNLEIDPKDAARLTLLRRLVTTLLVVMIAGFLVLITLLVTRFPSMDAPVSETAPLPWPDQIALPEGITPEAVTRGSDWIAVVSGNEILIFDAEGGALRQRISVTPAQH